MSLSKRKCSFRTNEDLQFVTQFHWLESGKRAVIELAPHSLYSHPISVGRFLSNFSLCSGPPREQRSLGVRKAPLTDRKVRCVFKGTPACLFPLGRLDQGSTRSKTHEIQSPNVINENIKKKVDWVKQSHNRRDNSTLKYRILQPITVWRVWNRLRFN